MAASTRDIKIPLIIFLSSFLDLPSFFFGFGSGGNGSIFFYNYRDLKASDFPFCNHYNITCIVIILFF